MNVNKNGQLCRTIWYNAQKFEVGLLAASAVQGHYLLKNGQKSIVPVYDQEYGVFIDENHYIPLKFSTRPLTYREAEVYYQSIGGEMPDLYEAVRLSLAVDSVNAALEKIGMSEFIFRLPSCLQSGTSKLFRKTPGRNAAVSLLRRMGISTGRNIWCWTKAICFISRQRSISLRKTVISLWR